MSASRETTMPEMLAAMGSEASDAEAEAMIALLKERGIDFHAMSDEDFFALIPEAIRRAAGV